jgi:hypothetical protein
MHGIYIAIPSNYLIGSILVATVNGMARLLSAPALTADGPDEVHRNAVAKLGLAKHMAIPGKATELPVTLAGRRKQRISNSFIIAAEV